MKQSNRNLFQAFLALALLLLLSAAGAAQTRMSAYFLPVGQAHATLLEFSCGAALIDAGAQDPESAQRLLEYLNDFFDRRADLHRTLDLVLITHNHIDHNLGLQTIAGGGIAIKNYVDDGILSGSGKAAAAWVRSNAHTGGRDIRVREVTYADIDALPGPTGLTDAAIDPIACADQDPGIHVLSGRVLQRPAGWTSDDFKNINNHSLVTRIDFGQASFLFMGDLEEKGIAMLLSHYTGQARQLLDADVMQVGHHGSYNATNQELLSAVTPKIAVIPVGSWDFGKGSKDKFTTNAYGHPRVGTLDLLTASIPDQRSQPIKVMAATAARKFSTYTVRKRIYATSWDGVVHVTANTDGQYRVTREGESQ